jgi:bacteriocin biosynthesis cyclodehydratase domain-containing protein
VEHADTGPGALDPADVGRRRQEAVCRAIQRLTPAARVAPAAHIRPDLAVLVPNERYPVELLDQLTVSGVAHLPVRTAGDEALIGPLVLPGRTPCLRCADLQQSESEPSWPRYLAQLAAPRPGGPAPRDTPLALLAAAHAVHSALTHLDGDRPPTLGAVLRLDPADGLPTRIEVKAHEACPCGAFSRACATRVRRGPGDFVGYDLLE